jgi:hypothetical protein
MEPVLAKMRSKPALSLRRLLLLVILFALPLAACNSGDECETCSSDDDCQTGFVCSTFSDGSMRCGTGSPPGLPDGMQKTRVTQPVACHRSRTYEAVSAAKGLGGRGPGEDPVSLRSWRARRRGARRATATLRAEDADTTSVTEH